MFNDLAEKLGIGMYIFKQFADLSAEWIRCKLLRRQQNIDLSNKFRFDVCFYVSNHGQITLIIAARLSAADNLIVCPQR